MYISECCTNSARGGSVRRLSMYVNYSLKPAGRGNEIPWELVRHLVEDVARTTNSILLIMDNLYTVQMRRSTVYSVIEVVRRVTFFLM